MVTIPWLNLFRVGKRRETTEFNHRVREVIQERTEEGRAKQHGYETKQRRISNPFATEVNYILTHTHTHTHTHRERERVTANSY